MFLKHMESWQTGMCCWLLDFWDDQMTEIYEIDKQNIPMSGVYSVLIMDKMVSKTTK